MGFSKASILETMHRTGLVPLFTHDNADAARQVLQAAYDGGIRVFEFTNRRPNSFDVFSALVRDRKNYPELMLGIGTVMDADTTKRFIEAGADFIISPILKTEMAPVCHTHDILWIPGCATLTEIVTARDHGAEIIKVFPGSVLGPGFVSSIMPVVPGLRLMITGGVEPTRENLSAWFKAGAFCVGMGSQLFTRELLNAKDWNGLSKKMTDSLSMIKSIRNEN